MHGTLKHRLFRKACAVWVAIELAFPVSRVLAEERGPADESESCLTAAERAQPLMRQKRFREARAELEMCARDLCPRVARIDCRNWLADVISEQPSILIVPQEVHGDAVEDVHGVRAIIDGAIAVENAEVNVVAIDPGRHRLRIERAGSEALEQDIEVREREKERNIHVYWRGARAIPSQVRDFPPAIYLTGALAAAAVGAGAYFEIVGLARRGELNGKCRPTMTCAQSDVDTARTITGIGDVALGVGLLLLASAAYLYWTRPISSPPARHAHLTWVLAPIPSGWAAGVARSW